MGPPSPRSTRFCGKGMSVAMARKYLSSKFWELYLLVSSSQFIQLSFFFFFKAQCNELDFATESLQTTVDDVLVELGMGHLEEQTKSPNSLKILKAWRHCPPPPVLQLLTDPTILSVHTGLRYTWQQSQLSWTRVYHVWHQDLEAPICKGKILSWRFPIIRCACKRRGSHGEHFRHIANHCVPSR